jgi:cell fate (sporulation/competence/biofilm development) regulator YmcA (YheA/YmcA/DUF963 family)
MIKKENHMEIQLNSISIQGSIKTDSRQTAQDLGKLLRQMPEFEIFLRALKAANQDPTVQKLGQQMRTHQNSQQWYKERNDLQASEMARLELEMEELPTVKKYRQAETEVKRLFRQVDEIVSQAAGVKFAENAKRGGGCCG